MTVLHKNNNFQSQLDEIEVHDIVKDRRKSTSQGIGGGGGGNEQNFLRSGPAKRFNHFSFYYRGI